MKFYILNPEIDEKIRKIKTKISVSMDGVVADKLSSMAITYKKNYGVSLPRLRQLALELGFDYDLSLRLWQMRERETMILALLTMPIDKLDKKIVLAWMNDVENIELCEQLSMHIVPKCSFGLELCLDAIAHESVWTKVCGFQSLARLYAQISEEQAAIVGQQVEKMLASDDVYLQKAMARCMSRIARTNSIWAQNWQKNIASKNYSHASVALINDEITQELKYFL